MIPCGTATHRLETIVLVGANAAGPGTTLEEPPATSSSKASSKCVLSSFHMEERRHHYKGIVIKTVWSWCQNYHLDGQNKTESPEINPGTLSSDFCQDYKDDSMGERTVYSTNAAGHLEDQVCVCV